MQGIAASVAGRLRFRESQPEADARRYASRLLESNLNRVMLPDEQGQGVLRKYQLLLHPVHISGTYHHHIRLSVHRMSS
jgi:hypothetical protein